MWGQQRTPGTSTTTSGNSQLHPFLRGALHSRSAQRTEQALGLGTGPQLG